MISFLTALPELLLLVQAAAWGSNGHSLFLTLFHMRVSAQALSYVAGWLFPSLTLGIWGLHYCL